MKLRLLGGAIPARNKSSASSAKWAGRQNSDPYVKKAAELGYRCRSAFKLIEIHQKVGILAHGMNVVEFGCAPGSWSQVATRYINADGIYVKSCPTGFLVGCDLLTVDPVPGARLIGGADFSDPKTHDEIVRLLANRPIDLVMSDMAPNCSGQKTLDHERIIRMAFQVLEFCRQHKSDAILVKLWQGGLFRHFTEQLEETYQRVTNVKPPSSRVNSAEIFVVAQFRR